MSNLGQVSMQRQKISNGRKLTSDMLDEHGISEALQYVKDLERLEEYEMCIGAMKAIEDYYKEIRC